MSDPLATASDRDRETQGGGRGRRRPRDRCLPLPRGAVRAAAHADPSVSRVIGVDVIPPPHDIGRAEFVRADIRNPMIGKIIAQAGVDTVVHMNVIATPLAAGGRASQKEINVIGTMQLLAACQKARASAAARREVVGRGLRLLARATRRCSPRTWGRSAAPRAASARTRSRSRATCAGSPGAGPTSRSPRCGSPTSSARGIRTSMTDYFALPVVPVPLGLRRPAAVRARGRRRRRAWCWPRPDRPPSASSTSPATASSR